MILGNERETNKSPTWNINQDQRFLNYLDKQISPQEWTRCFNIWTVNVVSTPSLEDLRWWYVLEGIKISFGTLSLMGTLMASHKAKLCKTKLTKHCSGCFWKKYIVLFFLKSAFEIFHKCCHNNRFQGLYHNRNMKSRLFINVWRHYWMTS